MASFKSFFPPFGWLIADIKDRMGAQYASRVVIRGVNLNFMDGMNIMYGSPVSDIAWQSGMLAGGGVTICKSRSKRVITLLACRITLLKNSVPCWIHLLIYNSSGGVSTTTLVPEKEPDIIIFCLTKTFVGILMSPPHCTLWNPSQVCLLIYGGIYYVKLCQSL